MKTTKHTPGPWMIRAIDVGFRITREDSGKYVTAINASSGWVGETEANAKLIAAAPDLLDALGKAYKELRLLNADINANQRKNTPAASVISLIESAIKKATE